MQPLQPKIDQAVLDALQRSLANALARPLVGEPTATTNVAEAAETSCVSHVTAPKLFVEFDREGLHAYLDLSIRLVEAAGGGGDFPEGVGVANHFRVMQARSVHRASAMPVFITKTTGLPTFTSWVDSRGGKDYAGTRLANLGYGTARQAASVVTSLEKNALDADKTLEDLDLWPIDTVRTNVLRFDEKSGEITCRLVCDRITAPECAQRTTVDLVQKKTFFGAQVISHEKGQFCVTERFTSLLLKHANLPLQNLVLALDELGDAVEVRSVRRGTLGPLWTSETRTPAWIGELDTGDAQELREFMNEGGEAVLAAKLERYERGVKRDSDAVPESVIDAADVAATVMQRGYSPTQHFTLTATREVASGLQAMLAGRSDFTVKILSS